MPDQIEKAMLIVPGDDAVVVPHEAKPGPPLDEDLRGALDDGRSGAEEEDLERNATVLEKVRSKVGAVEIVRKSRAVKEPACNVQAGPVI